MDNIFLAKRWHSTHSIARSTHSCGMTTHSVCPGGFFNDIQAYCRVRLQPFVSHLFLSFIHANPVHPGSGELIDDARPKAVLHL